MDILLCTSSLKNQCKNWECWNRMFAVMLLNVELTRDVKQETITATDSIIKREDITSECCTSWTWFWKIYWTFLTADILTWRSTRVAHNNDCCPCRCASNSGTPWNVYQLHLKVDSKHICHWPNLLLVAPTYAANGQGEAHSVQHCGGDCAVVERVLDAVVVTEKARLIGADLTQVKGCERQTSCGRRDQEGGGRGQRSKTKAWQGK